MFLAGGRLAYFGEPTKAVELLGRFGYPCPINYNPADAMIQVFQKFKKLIKFSQNLSVEMHKEEQCQQRIRHICAEWERSTEGAEFREEVEKRRRSVKERPERRKTASCLVQVNSDF